MMTPPMQPVLTDGRVLLRPAAPDDWDALYGVARDPLLWAIHPAHNRWQESVFRRYFDDGLSSGGALVIIDRVTDTVIGGSRYDNRREACEPGEVEIGWTYISRSHWGGTWNRAVKRLMIGYAFERGFEAAIFLVGETNLRSRRAMEKIGGVLTDRTQVWDMAGVPTRHVIYRITPQDFASGPLSSA